MKLLICLVSHNRLGYTGRTLHSLIDSIQLPYYLVAFDNASTDGTQKELIKWSEEGKINRVIMSNANLYPGAATNRGWEVGLQYYDATHLMRLDNDMDFKRGWDLKAEEYFSKIDRLGQLGLDWSGGENKTPQYYNGMGLVEWPGSVGGPNIIRREIWDSGTRYDETKWEGTRSKLQEDVRLSRKIKEDGWLVGHMEEKYSWTFATPETWGDYPDYYRKTMYDRGYDEIVEKLEKYKWKAKQ